MSIFILLQGYERQNGDDHYDKSPKSLPPYGSMSKMEGIAGKQLEPVYKTSRYNNTPTLVAPFVQKGIYKHTNFLAKK
jgi:hypothetical protein